MPTMQRCATPCSGWACSVLKCLGRGALLAAVLWLAGCAAPLHRPDALDLEGQLAREALLAGQQAWQLSGRLAVAHGDDGGSGTLQWQQEGDSYRFQLNAPVTGKVWLLHGGADHAVLEGVRNRPLTDSDPRRLLARELGWTVPLPALVYWVRGARAPGPAEISLGSSGLPGLIEQDGWSIRYLDYDLTTTPPLPRRIFAEKGADRVRLVVREWQVR